MKRVIAATSDKAQLMQALKAHNIDTTVNQYEMMAEAYMRTGDGDVYTIKFKAPGDYIAYFAMYLHEPPKPSEVAGHMTEYAGSVEEWFKEYPDERAMSLEASGSWWGDGDDFIYYLKNLTTGEILYSSGEDPEVYEDEEDYWDDEEE